MPARPKRSEGGLNFEFYYLPNFGNSTQRPLCHSLVHHRPGQLTTLNFELRTSNLEPLTTVSSKIEFSPVYIPSHSSRNNSCLLSGYRRGCKIIFPKKCRNFQEEILT